MSTTFDLHLVPASPRSRLLLFALVVLLPQALVLAMPLLLHHALPGHPIRLHTQLLAICLPTWIAMALLMRRHRGWVRDGVLYLQSTFFTRKIAIEDLDLALARVVDLDDYQQFRPRLKTGALSLSGPGFRSGWFLLRGGQRAFVAISNGRWKLWLPSFEAHDLLIEPRDPHAALDHLRSLLDHPHER